MELEDLYQEMVLEHAKSSRRRGEVEVPTHAAHGYNPLCGDEIQLSLAVENGVIRDARFDGCGCALSSASASMLLDLVLGKSLDEALRMIDELQYALIHPDERPAHGDFIALQGVSRFPMRVKCVTLALHTLRDAIQRSDTMNA